MPNAQVVADRFHVAAQVNKELDTQIKCDKKQAKDLFTRSKSSQKKAECQQILDKINGSKYSLFKNAKNLDGREQIKLMSVKKVCPALEKMHKLKEKFRQIFERKTN